MNTIGGTNFLKLKYWNPFKTEYMFIDVINPIIEDQFEKRNIKVKYIAELRNIAIGPYVVRICRIPKRFEPGFEEAMSELMRRIMIAGYTDYIGVCNNVMKSIDAHEELQKFIGKNNFRSFLVRRRIRKDE